MADDQQKSKIEYDFAAHETPLFEAWKEGGYFRRSDGKGDFAEHPFTIVIPPPNITGMLHMGHALNDTIQDTCIRHARMQGRPTRWILGTDHAGIATQTKVDKKLAEEGISRYEIGREAFVDECWKWREQYGNTIVNQIKGMGCSCDYDDEHFTLDPDYANAVRRVFTEWYHDGIIYRGKRIVNWCPHCGTAIADDEAEYVPEKGHLWYLRYPLVEPVDGHDYIVVATTRPETMLGDTGVAVSPKDPEAQKFVGAKVALPIVGREIPIFSDFYVDAGFGTGFVKVTPSHDPNDWAMGERNGLEKINIFDATAHVVEGYGKFSGMSRDEAREAIVAEFESLGLLDHVEDHDHSVMTCYRCHTKLEPWESEQWFVSVDGLKKEAARVVEDGEIQFHPARWKQVYLDWLANLKDWCISRQLWWGHRIPMFYCDSCGWQDASVEDVRTCPECGAEVRQDTDVLDTWFSSQLWPFATMGWTTDGNDAAELQFAYPTQVLSTARDIMGLWVARMVMASMYFTHKIPFEHVIIHPTVMGADGKPMSKSRGNGVDPLRLMKDYGADGMRFGMLMQVTGAQDLKFNEAKLENSRNFANKIRNAARFVNMHLDGYTPGAPDHHAGRPVDFQPLGQPGRPFGCALRELRVRRDYARAVFVLLERVLRLVHRVLEEPPRRGQRRRRQACVPAQPDVRARPGHSSFAPHHAVCHRGDLPRAAFRPLRGGISHRRFVAQGRRACALSQRRCRACYPDGLRNGDGHPRHARPLPYLAEDGPCGVGENRRGRRAGFRGSLRQRQARLRCAASRRTALSYRVDGQYRDVRRFGRHAKARGFHRGFVQRFRGVHHLGRLGRFRRRARPPEEGASTSFWPTRPSLTRSFPTRAILPRPSLRSSRRTRPSTTRLPTRPPV